MSEDLLKYHRLVLLLGRGLCLSDEVRDRGRRDGSGRRGGSRLLLHLLGREGGSRLQLGERVLRELLVLSQGPLHLVSSGGGFCFFDSELGGLQCLLLVSEGTSLFVGFSGFAGRHCLSECCLVMGWYGSGFKYTKRELDLRVLVVLFKSEGDGRGYLAH